MKTIVIGDIHGSQIWKKILAQEIVFDLVIFIGDYFDSFHYTALQQIDNFRDMLAFKRANPSKVILLLGNHDYHYLESIHEQYRGHQVGSMLIFRHMLEEAIRNDEMKICHVEGNILFSHAGLTKTFCLSKDIDLSDIENSINDLFRYQRLSFRMKKGWGDSGDGDSVTQGPLWVRPLSLFMDMIDGYIQVVGHTMMPWLVIKPPLIFIDTLGTSSEYLVIQDGKFTAKKIT